ncbi:N/A [soil metagenome]
MKKKIFVIEDCMEMCENICELLEISGYKVQSCNDGNLGIQMVKEFKPDLILCDIMMNEMDGYAVIQHLSKELAICDIPIVMISALSEKRDIEKAKELGAKGFLVKPFEGSQLMKVVEFHLQK